MFDPGHERGFKSTSAFSEAWRETGGFNMNDKRQSLVSQGGEDGGRREMMLQRMTLKT